MNSGVTAALLAYGLWGLMPLYFRLMAPATAIEVVAHRIVWSLALLLLWLGVRGQFGPLWRRLDARLLARLALAALLVSINWLTYVWAVTHGRTLDASLGYFLLPLFNVALGVLLLGERLTRGEWIGVMLAALGVGYLALVSPRLPWVALVLAASFGVYGLVCPWWPSPWRRAGSRWRRWACCNTFRPRCSFCWACSCCTSRSMRSGWPASRPCGWGCWFSAPAPIAATALACVTPMRHDVT